MATVPMYDGCRKTGSSCTVPNNDCARLMYYLNCKHYFSELSKFRYGFIFGIKGF